MKTKLFKTSKRIFIILFAVFNIAGIIACANSDITGSGEISSSSGSKKTRFNTNLPTWEIGHKPDLSGPEPDFYHVVRYTASGSSKLDKAYMNYVTQTENLKIYVEKGHNYNMANINQVAAKFEDNYKQMTNIYGTHTDMDKNGRIKLFFVNINESSGSGILATGYFYPNDLVYGSANNGEILYMDITLLNLQPQEIAATVLHEFQHLINFNVNYIKKGKRMSLWLDESLAESTAILFDNTSTRSRILEFNQINYYCFYTWNLPSNSYGFVNYPSASVFMNWLYIKNGRNSNIFKKIASSSQTQDYDKVLKSVSGNYTWNNLLKDWISGVKNGAVSGALVRARSSATLYPGAVVWDGSQVRVNPSTELANPSKAAITISRENSVMGRSMLNDENNDEEVSLQNNSGPKYIDLSFDIDGKIRKY